MEDKGIRRTSEKKKATTGLSFLGMLRITQIVDRKFWICWFFVNLATDKENLIVLVEISVKRNPTGTVVLLIDSMKSIDLKPIYFRCSNNFSGEFTVFAMKVVYILLPKFSPQVFFCANFEMYYTCIATEMSQLSRIYYFVFSIESEGSRAIRRHIAFFSDMHSSWILKWQKVKFWTDAKTRAAANWCMH